MFPSLVNISKAVSAARFHGSKVRIKSGFTLIETLVTVAVVAILAALIFSSVNSVGERGKQLKSLSNMKTITGALISYAAENGMRIPSHDATPEPPTWDATILPYLGFQYAPNYTAGRVTSGNPTSALDIFRCPLDSRKGTDGTHPRSYAVSGVAINPIGLPPPDPAPFSGGKIGRPIGEGINLLEVKRPSKLVLLVRIPKIWELPDNVVGERGWVANNGASSMNRNDPHWKIFGGKTPYGFADGHVELCPFEQSQDVDPEFWTYDK